MVDKITDLIDPLDRKKQAQREKLKRDVKLFVKK